MLCEWMNMTVHVVNGIHNNVPCVREVVCIDRYGTTWNTYRMNDKLYELKHLYPHK